MITSRVSLTPRCVQLASRRAVMSRLVSGGGSDRVHHHQGGSGRHGGDWSSARATSECNNNNTSSVQVQLGIPPVPRIRAARSKEFFHSTRAAASVFFTPYCYPTLQHAAPHSNQNHVSTRAELGPYYIICFLLLSITIIITIMFITRRYVHQIHRGARILLENAATKGMAFTDQERAELNILGLLPPAHRTQEVQVKAALNFVNNIGDNLTKYIYLRNLKDYNERMFYKTLAENVETLMPIVYTPVVGLACQKFSHTYLRPRGLYVTINDLGRVGQVIANWPYNSVHATVVTDGERILGLGDLGANGMGISIGKLSLYTALAGIPPHTVMPVCLDVGTNNQSLLEDEFYVGLRQERVTGDKYFALIDEFMEAVVDRFGKSCLIQFEDFANQNAFKLLEKYRGKYCTFNDDISGTASVSLSGLISASRLAQTQLSDHTFFYFGAGEANLGSASLLVEALVDGGMSQEDALDKIWMMDIKGLLVEERDSTDWSSHKKMFKRKGPMMNNLSEILDMVRPSVLVGASAATGAFTPEILKKMTTFADRPIIFALSNPNSKAECTAAQAYEHTRGKCIFASGSPFEPVEFNGKTYTTGQGNNSYIFPGIALAVMAAQAPSIPDKTFIVAARALSDQVYESELEAGLVYPRIGRIRDVTLHVASKVMEYFYAEGLTNYHFEPKDKLAFLRDIQYDYNYDKVKKEEL